MGHELLDTLDQMTREQLPNLFRLYLNPHVAGACLCLNQLAQETWYGGVSERPEFQTFLANSFDEALSGALKLARFVTDVEGRPKAGVIIGGGSRLDHFASLSLGRRGTLELIPDLFMVAGEPSAIEGFPRCKGRVGYVVLFPASEVAVRQQVDALIAGWGKPAPLIIAAVDRAGLDACRREPWDGLAP